MDVDNIPNVGPISTLEYMVENTITTENVTFDKILVHLSTLDDYIFRWRSVAGDGNCFYRSVIFAYLEHIIFRRDIIALKKIIVDINVWFDKDYLQDIQNLNYNQIP